MSDTKLLPCPCCGKSDYAEYHTDYETMLVNIICNAEDGGCGLATGYGDDSDEAFKIWNTRTPTEGYVTVPKDDYLAVMNAVIDSLSEEQARALCEKLAAEFPEQAKSVELPTVILPEGSDKFKGLDKQED